MSSNWGNQLKLLFSGKATVNGIGVVLDGLPAGIPIDQEEILAQMARRLPAGIYPPLPARRKICQKFCPAYETAP